MPCGACGANTEPGQTFCGVCGADLRAAIPPPVAQQPVAPPVPPQQPPLLPGQRVAAPAAAPPSQPKRGLSSGAIAGIVAGVLVVVALLGVGAVFALRAMSGSGQSVVVSTPTPPLSTPPPAAVPTQSVDTSADSGTQAPVEAPSDEIVTDAEARDVVTEFMDLRLAMDVAGSKKLCTKNMLNGEDTKPMVNDKYWRPESYEIVKTTPDLMYIHVAIMGRWPSGDEPSIFSVFRDPETGQVLIDGMLDPENVPELWK